MHLILYVHPPPILILVSFLQRSAFWYQLRCWLQRAVRGVGFDDGGKGGMKPRNHPLCVGAVSYPGLAASLAVVCFSDTSICRPPCQCPQLPIVCTEVCPSSSLYRETHFTSLQIQLLICSLSNTINSRDRKTCILLVSLHVLRDTTASTRRLVQ
jgi:hypothetical protein